MIDNVLRPFAEGFWGCMALFKAVVLNPLSLISVLKAFVNAPRLSDFNPTRRPD